MPNAPAPAKATLMVMVNPCNDVSQSVNRVYEGWLGPSGCQWLNFFGDDAG
jgi:hypothetical protein